MTLKYDVKEAESWDDEKADQVIAYLRARPWLQSDLDEVLKARGIDEAEQSEPKPSTPYDEMTKEDLQEELSARGLHTSGNKDELIARLQEADEAAA